MLARACREASEELGFEISPTVVYEEEWQSDATGFIRSIKAGPLISLVTRGPGAHVKTGKYALAALDHLAEGTAYVRRSAWSA